MVLDSKKKNFSTFLGIFALFFWAFNALCAVELRGLPLNEYLFCILFTSFFLAAVRYTVQRRWWQVRQYWKQCVVGGMILAAFEVCYYSAFRFAPPAHVDLINYLWPIFILLGSPFFLRERLSWSYILSALIGFFSIFLLVLYGDGARRDGLGILGYMLAFCGACFWALFSLYARKHKDLPSDIIGMYCGVAALVFGLLHLVQGPFIVPNGKQLWILLFTGFGATAFAFWFWDIGMKRGHYRLLTLLSYFTPSFSIGVLVLFGRVVWHPVLLVSCGLIVLASALPKLIEIFQKSPSAVYQSIPK